MSRWELYDEGTDRWMPCTLKMAIAWMLDGGEVRCSDV